MRLFSQSDISVSYIQRTTLFWIGKNSSFFVMFSELLNFASKDPSRRSYPTQQSYTENHSKPKAFPWSNFSGPYLGNLCSYNDKLWWYQLDDDYFTTRGKYCHFPGCYGPAGSSDNLPCWKAYIWYVVFIQISIDLPNWLLAFQGQNKYFQEGKNSLGVRYGNHILLIISLLLVVREAFTTATVKNNAKENDEHFLYPFLVIPEYLVVILFTAPGLVPRQDEVPEYALTDTTPQYATRPYPTTSFETTPHANTTNPYATDTYAVPAAYTGIPQFRAWSLLPVDNAPSQIVE